NCIERVEHRFHTGVGTPKRDDEADREVDPQPAATLRLNMRDLVSDDLNRVFREHPLQVRELLLDGVRIGKESVKRDKRRNGREESKQRVVGDTGGNQHHAIALKALIDPPQDILPAGSRDLRRALCFSTAPRGFAAAQFLLWSWRTHLANFRLLTAVEPSAQRHCAEHGQPKRERAALRGGLAPVGRCCGYVLARYHLVPERADPGGCSPCQPRSTLQSGKSLAKCGSFHTRNIALRRTESP